MKDAAIAGTVVAVGANARVKKTAAGEGGIEGKQTKCPFFDQPLMCNGPDKSGKYRCEE